MPFGFLEFGIKDFVETIIIATILFYVYKGVKGSFAIPAFIGLIFIFILNATVSLIGLTTINFFLGKITDVGILAVFILFQPEIRRLLYSLGQNTSIERLFKRSQSNEIITEVVEAVKVMSRTKTGALIVFSRSATLQDIIDNGVGIDAKIKKELILTLFNKHTPLHDGAIVIKGDRIVAASCYLPLSQNPNISTSHGTRHRAAAGVTEINHVFVVVVSEETGRISISEKGKLVSGLTPQKLRSEMEKQLSAEKELETQIPAFSSGKEKEVARSN